MAPVIFGVWFRRLCFRRAFCRRALFRRVWFRRGALRSLGAATLVLTRLAVLDELVERVLGVTAYVADGHPALLGLVPGDLDVLPAAFLGQLGEDHPDDRAVVRRVHPKIAVADRLLDRRQRRLVVGLHDDHAGFGYMEGRKLVQRSLRAIVLRRDLAEHGRMRASRPDPGEIVLGDPDRLFHFLLGFEERVLNHYGSCAAS